MSTDARRERAWLGWLISPGIPILILIVVAAIVRGWGDFPLNDDWQYSHIAKVFAETGEIHIDRPIAPALVVQTIVGGNVISLFGFSFVSLKLLTCLIWILGMVAADAILRRANAGALVRALALTTLTLTPYTILNSLSFMTEVWGTTPALIAIWVWIARPADQRITLSRAGIVASLAGIAFLTRQFSGIVGPAILLAYLIISFRAAQLLTVLRRDWLALLFFIFVFAAIVVTHAVWARATGNQPEAVSGPLRGLLRNKTPAWAVMSGLSLLYLIGLLAPLFVLFPLPKLRQIINAAVLLGIAIALFRYGHVKYQTRHLFHAGKPYDGQHYAFNGSMPFMTNIVGEAGIGPVTTTDVYIEGINTRPRYNAAVWRVTEWLLEAAVLLLLWPVCHLAARRLKNDGQREVVWIGGVFAGVTLAASLQLYGFEVFDRYLWTPFVALILVLGALLAEIENLRRRLLAFALLLAPISVLTIGGTHDYFAFQRYRWSLYGDLLKRGVSPLSIDAGYEPNGWYAYEGWSHNETSPSCIATCVCRSHGWYCVDDSYRIGFALRRNDLLVDRIFVPTWLLKRPTLVVGRRPDP